MALKKIAVCGLLFVTTASLQHRPATDENSAVVSKSDYKKEVMKILRRQILQQAAWALQQQPVTVTAQASPRSAGGKHDFFSEGDYWWPNPQFRDSPYVQRDGMTNPDNFVAHRQAMIRLSRIVGALASAYQLTGDEKYVAQVLRHCKAWFVDTATIMNPHLQYAQAIKGRFTGRGIGIIDTIQLMEVVQGLLVMENARSMNHQAMEAIRSWFEKYLQWLTTHPYGKDEMNAANNHGTCWVMQTAAFAKFTHNDTLMRFCRDRYKNVLLPNQMAADGSFPQELRRTKPYGYSIFNLDALATICQILSTPAEDLWAYTTPDGRNIRKGIEYLYPFIADKSKWPKSPDVMYWNDWPVAQPFLIFGANAYDNKEWFKTWKRLDHAPTEEEVIRNLPVRHPLIWFCLKLSPVFADAEKQTQVMLTSITEAKGNKTALVAPRTLENGQLKLVAAGDWTSGFFAGELWMLYAFTHKPEWKSKAEAFTSLLEKEKMNGGTHDMGFKIYCSYGTGYQITKDAAYKDVIIQSAKTLSTRFNPVVGCIRSWDHHKEQWGYPVIIDNMMNLELLFAATRLTGDSSYYKIAVSHANTTMKNHFRSDYSSYHVIDYDTLTGKAVKKNTHQGYADGSAWARGQAWGLYGYTMCYRETKNAAYLQQAEHIATFILHHPNLPADKIPYWDFNAPGIPDEPRDVSAASVLASGLIELAQYSKNKKEYLAAANTILQNITQHYRSPIGENKGFILLHSTGSKPANSEVDAPLTYGDYYYLEALLRKSKLK